MLSQYSVFFAIFVVAIIKSLPLVAIDTQVPEGSILQLYMHDILGGNNPTARSIIGLLGNIYSGQVPFARPLGFQPPKDGVSTPNSNGEIPIFNINCVPVGTGLAGTIFAGNQNGQDSGMTTQLGPDGLSLGFGT
uniref:Dirigent protein n=1 Tax=Solanum lycopersicum TaxID=4081 RepID=A0A3Q7GS32_SOLLC